jgi:ATP-dependent DNA helicase DinG
VTLLASVTLPPWAPTLRPHQSEAIDEILAHFTTGAFCVFLDGPTGVGKTLIGEVTAQVLNARTVYACSSLTLQDQFAHDFPHAAVLKGRSNYSPLGPHLPDITCADCTKDRRSLPACPACDSESEDEVMHCTLCHPVELCPYELAKLAAMRAPLACTNTSYFLYESNYVGALRAGRDLIIIDEADTLEDALMSYVTVHVSDRRARSLSLYPPERKTVESSWVEWAASAQTTLQRAYDACPRAHDTASVRERNALERLLRDVKRLNDPATGISAGGWVLDYDTKSSDASTTFKPVRVDALAYDNLWRHAPKFLLMSATTISFAAEAEALGLRDGAWAGVAVPSPFPAANRPILIHNIAPMNFKEKKTSTPKIITAINIILDKHPNDRVLIHGVSYDLTKDIVQGITGRQVFHYLRSADRASAISGYLATPKSVLVAPSLDRGVDFKDDLCRVIIVAKVPFPALGDKQISARLHSKGGQVWYAVRTIRTLIQMTGRGMRHENDSVTTYILDSDFIPKVLRRSAHLIPKWWGEAMRPSGPTINP